MHLRRNTHTAMLEHLITSLQQRLSDFAVPDISKDASPWTLNLQILFWFVHFLLSPPMSVEGDFQPPRSQDRVEVSSRIDALAERLVVDHPESPFPSYLYVGLLTNTPHLSTELIEE